MAEKRNKGGRPRDSGIDDRADLNALADLMIREPELKKTPAIARIVQRHPEHRRQAVERRLLRKWNDTAEQRLAEARQRHAERHRPASGSTATPGALA